MQNLEMQLLSSQWRPDLILQSMFYLTPSRPLAVGGVGLLATSWATGRCLSVFTWATAAKSHWPGSLNDRNLLSQNSGGCKPRPGCQQGFLFLRSLSLACGWPSSPSVFTWSSCVCVCLLISYFYKDLGLIGLRPTLMASF